MRSKDGISNTEKLDKCRRLEVIRYMNLNCGKQPTKDISPTCPTARRFSVPKLVADVFLSVRSHGAPPLPTPARAGAVTLVIREKREQRNADANVQMFVGVATGSGTEMGTLHKQHRGMEGAVSPRAT